VVAEVVVDVGILLATAEIATIATTMVTRSVGLVAAGTADQEVGAQYAVATTMKSPHQATRKTAQGLEMGKEGYPNLAEVGGPQALFASTEVTHLEACVSAVGVEMVLEAATTGVGPTVREGSDLSASAVKRHLSLRPSPRTQRLVVGCLSRDFFRSAHF
jgi:hypothetical protein